MLNGDDAERRRQHEAARKEEKRHLEKEAFQLANYYFVFQGVVFTAFYHAPPSQIKCRYKWVPMTLSALAGFLNICALFEFARRYKTILDEEDAILIGGRGTTIYALRKMWRTLYVFASMIIVFAFLVVTLYGCRLVTCATD